MFKDLSDMTRSRPPSMLKGRERATVQLSSKETVQIKLVTPKMVKTSTDKPKAFGGGGCASFLVINMKRQTRAARPNRITIPFEA